MTVPAANVNCVECLQNGHRVQAIEYVDGKALCMWCRDGDKCPQCETINKQRAVASGKAPAPLPPPPERHTFTTSPREISKCKRCGRPRHRGRCVEATNNPALRAGQVTLDEIEREYKGENSFSAVNGIAVRYPSKEEVRERTHPGPKPSETDVYLDLVVKSPTGCAEFKIPAGTKASSFAARLGNRGRKRERGAFAIFQDKKRNTVIVQHRKPLSASAAAGGSR